MPNYVDVPQANGEIKIKAVCRVRKSDGKQAYKTKTFKQTERKQAEAWAESTEREMKVERKQQELAALKQPVSDYLPFESAKTVGDLIAIYADALRKIQALGSESFLLIRSEDIVHYFEKRVKEGASKEAIRLESDLLYAMFKRRDGVTGLRDTNLVQMAITALHTKGVID